MTTYEDIRNVLINSIKDEDKITTLPNSIKELPNFTDLVESNTLNTLIDHFAYHLFQYVKQDMLTGKL